MLFVVKVFGYSGATTDGYYWFCNDYYPFSAFESLGYRQAL